MPQDNERARQVLFHITAPSDLTTNGQEKEIDTPFAQKRQAMSYHEDRWFYWVRVGFLLLASVVSAAIVIIYLWHLVMPQNLRWLCDNDFSRLKDLALTIIVGIILSLTTTYFFNKKNK